MSFLLFLPGTLAAPHHFRTSLRSRASAPLLSHHACRCVIRYSLRPSRARREARARQVRQVRPPDFAKPSAIFFFFLLAEENQKCKKELMVPVPKNVRSPGNFRAIDARLRRHGPQRASRVPVACASRTPPEPAAATRRLAARRTHVIQKTKKYHQ